MNWKNFIRGLLISTLIFGGIVLGLTIFTTPEKPTSVIIYLFSTFFFLLGITSISGFYFRKWWTHNEVLFSNVKISIRQAVLTSAFLVALLILSSFRLLTWWDGLVLGISFFLIELYFKTRE